MIKIVHTNLELIFWVFALVILFFMPVDESHFSLCPLGAMGIETCPGCGIGHSIHYILHLDPGQAWVEHKLGIFAVAVILYRIFKLLRLKSKPAIHGQ